LSFLALGSSVGEDCGVGAVSPGRGRGGGMRTLLCTDLSQTQVGWSGRRSREL